MKEGRKHIARTMCLMILAVLLCGCGKEQDVSDSGPAGGGSGDLSEGYVLFARYEDAGGETQMKNTYLVGNSLYYKVHYYDSVQDGIVQQVCVQEEGKEAQQLTQRLGIGDSKRLEAMAAGEDGNLYFLYGETDGEIREYTLEKRDQELQVIYSVDITENMEDIYIYDMEAGADGTVYGLTIKGIVICWDEKGVYQGQFALPISMSTAKGEEICYGLANAGASGVYAYWAGEDQESGNSIHLYDLKKWMEMDEAGRESAAPLRADFASAAESVVADSGETFFIFSGYEDGLYLGDKNRLWWIDLTDGSLEALLDWQDFSLKPGYVKEVQRQEGGGFLFYIFDTLEQENYWIAMEPVPASELPEKRELVLGVAGGLQHSQSLTSRIEQVVLSYNRTHPYCNITVKEYEENDITNFQLELLKGEGPDILMEMESFFDMESLVGRGLVEDLAPYIAKSEMISEDDILPGILELATKGGKISRIPLSFSVNVMILPKDMGQNMMTPQEMAEFMADSAYVDYLVYPTYLLYDILKGAEMDHYVDGEEKKCSFDSEEFVSLLESLDKLKEMETIGGRGERAEAFRSGQLNAVVEEMGCLEDYICIREAFSGVGEITGFPNSSGELRYPAKLYDWMGINSATEYKEDAWSFIEFCLSYMSRSDDMADRFVVTKDKFEKQTHLEKEISYLIDWNFYNENWEGWQEIDPMTQEETDLLWGISEHLYLYEDDDLMNVIWEEAGAFFSGDISAKEAAERIQNRANLIVNE